MPRFYCLLWFCCSRSCEFDGIPACFGFFSWVTLVRFSAVFFLGGGVVFDVLFPSNYGFILSVQGFDVELPENVSLDTSGLGICELNAYFFVLRVWFIGCYY